MTTFRTFLALGRVSNLPTVWSNCLAGWLLAGGGEWPRFVLLCLGATWLYIAGMFLNDAFDAQWDQQRRPERPIPSGVISTGEVWQWGLLWMALGLGCLALLGKDTIILALLLAGCIFIYDAIHKIFAFSPVLMAGCRFLLALTAASAARDGAGGLAFWSALALGAYVVGVSFLAQAERSPANLRFWPCLFLAVPVVLAMVVNRVTFWSALALGVGTVGLGFLALSEQSSGSLRTWASVFTSLLMGAALWSVRGDFPLRAVTLACLFTIWGLRCLRFTYWSPVRNVAHSTGGLLAGIVLVDLLALAGGSDGFCLVFVLLFIVALLLQRLIPAT